MNTTLRAAVHLGKDYGTNFHHAKNHIWDSLEHFFGEIKRLICEQSEILGPKTPEIVGLKIIESEETTWRSTTLLCKRDYQITLPKFVSSPTQYFVWARWKVPKRSLDNLN